MSTKHPVVVVDLDGTVCTEMPTFERALAKPFPKAVKALQELNRRGVRIVIYTGRGWAEYALTEAQLADWGVPYSQLVCGKPIGDLWVDDRAMDSDDWETILEFFDAR